MTPEAEFSEFVLQEARKRKLSFFVLGMNPDTKLFSYRFQTFDLDADPSIVKTIQLLEHMFRDAGATPTKS